MKTVEEIKKKLEVYKKIRDNASVFIATLASGAVTALEWVIEDSEDENANTL